MGLLIAKSSNALIERAGAPEGVVSAALGTIYHNTTTGDKYEKTTRGGTTGWKLLGGSGGGGTDSVFFEENL